MINTVEQQNQAQRRANQAKNGMQQDADNALAAQNQADQTAQAQKANNAARANQMNRVATGTGSGFTGTLLSPIATPSSNAPATGGGTLLGG